MLSVSTNKHIYLSNQFSYKRAPGSHVEGEGRRSARKGASAVVKEQDEEAGKVEQLVVTDGEFSEEGGVAGRTNGEKFSYKRAPGSLRAVNQSRIVGTIFDSF